MLTDVDEVAAGRAIHRPTGYFWRKVFREEHLQRTDLVSIALALVREYEQLREWCIENGLEPRQSLRLSDEFAARGYESEPLRPNDDPGVIEKIR